LSNIYDLDTTCMEWRSVTVFACMSAKVVESKIKSVREDIYTRKSILTHH
jgi:hypothetical protein